MFKLTVARKQNSINYGDMIIASPAFESGQTFPKKYTCQDENINPPLVFRDVPPGTESLALIFEDIDAENEKGTFLHWIIWNIPGDVSALDENAVIGTLAVEGENDGDRDYYEGPCPPKDLHRYIFRLYALDAMLELPKNARRSGLHKAMGEHILAEAELSVTYKKDQG